MIMTKRYLLLSALTLTSLAGAWAQAFADYFTDATLRLDYVLAGDAKHQEVYVDKLCTSPGWYGKRHRLAEVPVEGYGQITLTDHATGRTIYRNSFSTLFQEWLTYDEAKQMQRAFESVLLVPMPKDTVDVRVELMNNRREVMTSMQHQVVPTDVLIHRIGENRVTPYEQLLAPADPERCIRIAFVAEGYTESEMEAYLSDCREAIDALFEHEPFCSMKERFSITAVKSASAESGTSEPSAGVWKNTALGSHFDTFYSTRYLTTLNLKRLHDVLAGTPYEHIIVLVNTDKYGGGGILNSYNLTSTHHSQFKPVVVHEFGHSLAGLADEYAYDFEQIGMYPTDVEPWEPNITTMVNFDAKWKDMMGQPGVDMHEGAGYSLHGVYRPAENCRMRANDIPEFCPVCQRALRRLIDFYTAP